MFPAITMARYSHLPKQGHLKTMFRIFGYLKNHSKGAIRFDLRIPEIKSVWINKWKELYPDALLLCKVNERKGVEYVGHV